MRQLIFAAVIMAAMVMAGCQSNQKRPSAGSNDSIPSENAVADSTVYGVCGENTAMHTLELITDKGDTLSYAMQVEEDAQVQGGLLSGDRLAVIGHKNADGEHVATLVINLTTLCGKWTSIDKNFEIEEGGIVKSNVQAETNPWTSWKICNGKLVLNKDTFQIDELGADSLYLENDKGIFTFKRQK